MSEEIQNLWQAIFDLQERISVLEKSRVSKFRLPKGYFDEEPDDGS